MGKRRRGGDHRIEQPAGIRSRTAPVRGVARRIDALVKPRQQRGGEVPARRKAQHRDPGRIDAIPRRPRPDQPHRALGILQRDVGARRPALAGQAIGQHEHGIAQFGEHVRHADTLVADRYEAVGAARNDQQRQAVRLGGLEDVQVGHRHAGNEGGAAPVEVLARRERTARRRSIPQEYPLRRLPGRRQFATAGRRVQRLARRGCRAGHHRGRARAHQQRAPIDPSRGVVHAAPPSSLWSGRMP